MRIILGLCLALFTLPAMACNTEAPSLAVRDATYAHDIQRVEALLDENQSLFERGKRTAEETRFLFRHFTVLRPDTFTFIDDYLRAYPDSPYALTAQAWANYVVSWQVRGEKIARDTYPDAMREFSRLQLAAWRHAEKAYRKRPRLIAASDALIKLANPNGQANARELILAEVMSIDPNAGTLGRAVAQVIRGWGGTWEMGARMCETHAPKVPNADELAVSRCKIPLADKFEDQFDWLTAQLKSGKFPGYEHLLLGFMFTSSWSEITRADAELIHRVMSMDGYISQKHLTSYDSLALKYDLPLMTETVSRRRHEVAQKTCEQSPVDIWCNNVLSEPIMTSLKNENGMITVKVVERPSPEAALEYAQNRVAGSPYNPEAWSLLLTQMMANNRFTHVTQAEPYRVNAIVYSNHDVNKLRSYLDDKFYEYDAFQRTEAGEFPAEMMKFFEGLDEGPDMICPMIRAARLIDATCKQGRYAGCDLPPIIESALATMETKANRQGICFRERTLPASALAFSPMPLDPSGI